MSIKRIILGTAGHIDHGKTTLVKALTGVETDRLQAEKERGITIELGFAPFNLPNGQKAAIVDVPGHERFIKQMLAGAFGIDMVLFVIAADEGIMPQSREHMDIIELLGVDKGIVVLSKKDLVDEEWQLLVEDEITTFLSKSILKDAPIIFVSAHTLEGIDELINKIEDLSRFVSEKNPHGQARLPIDRAFTMQGFGSVVTGTLWSGKISVGEQLELLPLGKTVRIRSLQVHNEKVEQALAGQRVAVNLQGVDLSDLERGYVLASPNYLQNAHRLNVKLRLLSSSQRSLKNWNRIRFYLATDESLGRVVLLDRDELLPGEEAYAQIVMEKAIVALKGDPFVIRYYSPVSTIGGGTIIETPAAKQKRFKEEVLDQLIVKEEGSLYELLLFEMEESPYALFSLDDLAQKLKLEKTLISSELEQLVQDQKIICLSASLQLYGSSYGLTEILAKITKLIATYHDQYPLRQGYSREDLRSRHFSQLSNKAFQALIKYWEQKNKISSRNNYISLASFQPKPKPLQAEQISKVKTMLEKAAFSPPLYEAIRADLALGSEDFSELINYLIANKIILRLQEDLYFLSSTLEEGKKILDNYFTLEKELSLAHFRDLLSTSRKYALPLMEHYDRIRYTKRVGNLRIKA